MSGKKAILLFGYDVEDFYHIDMAKKFLEVAPKIHAELEMPCTFFICGRVLEKIPIEFQNVKKKYGKYIDFQQHTYSHIALKTVVMEDGKTTTIFKGATLEQIEDEINKTNVIFKKVLDENCIGITGPFCYYRGLSDRPDILEILHNAGIRLTRTYGRNENDYQPLSFSVQPFWYKPQGFADILECPLQGWQDCLLRDRYGYKNTDRYLNHIKKDLDKLIENKLVWGYLQHDWSSIKENPDMSMTKKFLEYVKKKKVEIMSYKDYYFLKNSEKVK